MNKDRLYDYLPPFFQQMLDIKEIVDTETIELKELEESIKKINNNFYVDTCDSVTLKEQYEDLLGIVAESDSSLDLRRIIVKNAWNNFTPYTLQSLKAKLYALFKDDYKVEVDYPNQNVIVKIKVEGSDTTKYQRIVESMLLTMLPTRMTYNFVAMEEIDSIKKLYQVSSSIEYVNVDEEYKHWVVKDGKIVDDSIVLRVTWGNYDTPEYATYNKVKLVQQDGYAELEFSDNHEVVYKTTMSNVVAMRFTLYAEDNNFSRFNLTTNYRYGEFSASTYANTNGLAYELLTNIKNWNAYSKQNFTETWIKNNSGVSLKVTQIVPWTDYDYTATFYTTLKLHITNLYFTY